MLKRIYNKLRTALFDHFSHEFGQNVEANTTALRRDIADLRADQIKTQQAFVQAFVDAEVREQALVERVAMLAAELVKHHEGIRFLHASKRDAPNLIGSSPAVFQPTGEPSCN